MQNVEEILNKLESVEEKISTLNIEKNEIQNTLTVQMTNVFEDFLNKYSKVIDKVADKKALFNYYDSQKWMSRIEVSSRLHLARHEIIKLEKIGVLKPETYKNCKYYDAEQILMLEKFAYRIRKHEAYLNKQKVQEK